ncbi:hypothetical protein [Sphingopyxis sp. BSNA05]|nr:hypothetical protein [Sphingopyxis sp. BSNA05]
MAGTGFFGQIFGTTVKVMTLILLQIYGVVMSGTYNWNLTDSEFSQLA